MMEFYEQTMFSKAINNKSSEYILKGSGLRFIKKYIKQNSIASNIINEIPMNFEKINKFIFDKLSDISYIEFWNNVKIFNVIY